jgi:hypothetical protein
MHRTAIMPESRAIVAQADDPMAGRYARMRVPPNVASRRDSRCALDPPYGSGEVHAVAGRYARRACRRMVVATSFL